MIVAALRDGAIMRPKHQALTDGRAPAEPSRAGATRGVSGRDDPPQRMGPSLRIGRQ
jgi:hypothetical protein